MTDQLNQIIATSNGVYVVTEKRILGVDCYLLVHRSLDNKDTVRSFLSPEIAFTELNKALLKRKAG